MMLWLDILLRFYVVTEPVIVGIWNSHILLFILIIVIVTDVTVTRPDVISPFYS